MMRVLLPALMLAACATPADQPVAAPAPKPPEVTLVHAMTDGAPALTIAIRNTGAAAIFLCHFPVARSSFQLLDAQGRTVSQNVLEQAIGCLRSLPAGGELRETHRVSALMAPGGAAPVKACHRFGWAAQSTGPGKAATPVMTCIDLPPEGPT